MEPVLSSTMKSRVFADLASLGNSVKLVIEWIKANNPFKFKKQLYHLDINECQSSPCQNGGTCVDLENSYACYCPDGFFRPLSCPAITTTTVATTTAASVPVLNQCEPNPCKNQGTCITFTNGIFYSCFCQNGFTGKYCEFPPHSSML